MKYRFHYSVEVYAEKELVITAETQEEAEETKDALLASKNIPITSKDIVDADAILVSLD